jgi:hypothetical protein
VGWAAGAEEGSGAEATAEVARAAAAWVAAVQEAVAAAVGARAVERWEGVASEAAA